MLLIDDDPSIRRALSLVFEDDYEFLTCASGSDGLAAMDVSVHAVLLDIKLHGEDGFWTYEEIRKRFSYTPIIFFSAFQNLKDPYQIINEYRPFGYVRKGDDIGELKRLIARAVAEYASHLRRETRLRMADRLAAAGTLAAGAAHEINNPLGYIVGNIEFALDQISSLRDALERRGGDCFAELKLALTSSLEGAQRIATIVNDLESFGKPPEVGEGGDTDLHRALDVAARMASNQIKHRARLVTEFADLPMVRADHQRLIQIFLNLLVNAAQALTTGKAEQNEIGIRTFTDGEGRAVVEIRDTGCGIPDELKDRIFDPFFTTKPTDIGTGLGLFVTHNLVESLGGTVRLVESSPEVGTAFHVTLPLSAASAVEQPVAEAPSAPGDLARRRILVVDDNPLIRAMLGRLLSMHDVVIADGGRVATELCRREQFDVILCDVMMPEFSGQDVYRAICESNPGLARRIVFMTGGVFDPAIAAFLDSIENARLKKPIMRHTLLSLLDAIGASERATAADE